MSWVPFAVGSERLRLVAERRGSGIPRLSEKGKGMKMGEMLIWKVRSAYSVELVVASTAETACARYREIVQSVVDTDPDNAQDLEPIEIDFVGIAT